jgi:2-C-methyl-D-erythritol 4-phosphate cytidylyltransferase
MSATDQPVHTSDPSEHLVVVADERLSVAALKSLVAGSDDRSVVVMMGESDHIPASGLAVGVDATARVVPVTDAIKLVDVDGLIVDTIDRNQLRTLSMPITIRVGSLRRSLEGRPAEELIDPVSLLTSDLTVVAATE